MKEKKIILASASPRRKSILKNIVEEFTVLPSTIEEKVDLSLSPEEIVRSLAYQKASDVLGKEEDAIVIGSDTVVAFQGRILGKPKDEADAFATLRSLSGNTHSVFTGVCVTTKEKTLCKSVESKVVFNELSDEFILAYIKSGSPMDKAGSYGIQDGGLVESYSGSYSNIIGFPEDTVREMLNEMIKETSKDENV